MDEIVDCLVNLLRREIGRRRAGRCVQLVVLERHLLLVVSPSEQLAGVGNLGNVGVVR